MEILERKSGKKRKRRDSEILLMYCVSAAVSWKAERGETIRSGSLLIYGRCAWRTACGKLRGNGFDWVGFWRESVGLCEIKMEELDWLGFVYEVINMRVRLLISVNGGCRGRRCMRMVM